MKSIVTLKILVSILTTFELSLAYIFIFVPNLNFLFDDYNAVLVNWLIHYIVVFIFIRFIVKKMNYEKKDRNENILMILFLGVIGMWIWLPNKEELKVFSK